MAITSNRLSPIYSNSEDQGVILTGYGIIGDAPAYTGQNYGELWNKYKTEYEAAQKLTPEQEALSRTVMTFNQDTGQPVYYPVGDRPQITEFLNKYPEGVLGLDLEKWGEYQGIILTKNYGTPGTENQTGPNTLGGYAQHYGFSNFDSMMDYQYGKDRKTIDDPVLGKIIIPRERDSQKWNLNPNANRDTSGGLTRLINAALEKPFGPITTLASFAGAANLANNFFSGAGNAALNAGEGWTSADYTNFNANNLVSNTGSLNPDAAWGVNPGDTTNLTDFGGDTLIDPAGGTTTGGLPGAGTPGTDFGTTTPFSSGSTAAWTPAQQAAALAAAQAAGALPGATSFTLAQQAAALKAAQAIGSAVTTGTGGKTGTTGTATTAAGTALSRILNGTATSDDWLSVLGTGAATAASMFTANTQAQSLSDLADRQMAAEKARYEDLVARENVRYGDLKAREDAAIARQRADIQFGRDIGAPSRARYEGSYAPGFTMSSDPGYQDALDASAKATLHGLSISGNPAGSPNAWAQSLADLNAKFAYPALQTYRSGNAATGGYASYGGAGASIPSTGSSLPGSATGGANIGTQAGMETSLASINAGRDLWTNLAGGLSSIFNPVRQQTPFADWLKQLGVR